MTSAEKSLPQARRFLVRGRVQGVGFRWFVEREAHILGIAGWVRNNPDGSVEVLAMGTREQLAGLRSRLREGPRAARVDNVEESDAEPVAGLNSFRVRGAGRCRTCRRIQPGLRWLKKLIREVPDFPKKGILFYDITTLLKDKVGFARADRRASPKTTLAKRSIWCWAWRRADLSLVRRSPTG